MNYYKAKDLIGFLEAIKKTELENLKEDCDNSDFLMGVSFGMNFIINRIKDYENDEESVLDAYHITKVQEEIDYYTYYTKKEWNEEEN